MTTDPGQKLHVLTAAQVMTRPLVVTGAPTWANIAYTAIMCIETARQARYYRSFLPYCLHYTKNPKVRCVVHRDYHAVGCSDWTNYEKAEQWHVGGEHFQHCVENGYVCERGYLYTDCTAPWHSKGNLKAYRRDVLGLLAPWLRYPTP